MDIERKSRIILSVLSFISVIFFLAFVYGSQTWTKVGAITVSFLLAIFLYSEGGIISYIRNKGYKKISGGDLVVWLTFIVATFILAFGLFQVPVIGTIVPQSWVTFTRAYATIGALLTVILSGIHAFVPKFS